jgi:hypothetical protein
VRAQPPDRPVASGGMAGDGPHTAEGKASRLPDRALRQTMACVPRLFSPPPFCQAPRAPLPCQEAPGSARRIPTRHFMQKNPLTPFHGPFAALFPPRAAPAAPLPGRARPAPLPARSAGHVLGVSNFKNPTGVVECRGGGGPISDFPQSMERATPRPRRPHPTPAPAPIEGPRTKAPPLTAVETIPGRPTIITHLAHPPHHPPIAKRPKPPPNPSPRPPPAPDPRLRGRRSGIRTQAAGSTNSPTSVISWRVANPRQPAPAVALPGFTLPARRHPPRKLAN